MKINKNIFLGALASAMLFASCNSESNKDLNANSSYNDSLEIVKKNRSMGVNDGYPIENEHPSTDEHPASSEHPADGEYHAVHNHEKEEVKLTLLPPAITESLKKERFSDCKVQRAYLVKNESTDRKIYEVEVKKGSGNATYLFQENGDVIEK
ncbi:MAG TPA: hypothetical protein VKY37_04655 [Brumimicrobium sp.]|nr:hypothetical protein [Brumimicrobium sp.]